LYILYVKSADKIVEDYMLYLGRQNRAILSADKIGRFCRPTKSGDFCMTHNRFLSGDFVGRKNRPILSFVWHRLKPPQFSHQVFTKARASNEKFAES